jgi:hypothetical protein
MKTPQQPGEVGVVVLAGVEAEQWGRGWARTVVHGGAGTGHHWPEEGVAEQVSFVAVYWTVGLKLSGFIVSYQSVNICELRLFIYFFPF